MLQQVMSVYIVMHNLDSHPLMEQNQEEPDIWRMQVDSVEASC